MTSDTLRKFSALRLGEEPLIFSDTLSYPLQGRFQRVNQGYFGGSLAWISGPSKSFPERCPKSASGLICNDGLAILRLRTKKKEKKRWVYYFLKVCQVFDLNEPSRSLFIYGGLSIHSSDG